MSKWSQQTIADIQQELEGARESDLRFFRIAEYLRMVKRVDDFSGNCPRCSQYKAEIEQQVKTIDSAINNTGKDRRNYDRHIDQLAKHMKKEHGFYPPYFYTYSLSFFYTLIAIVIGFLASLMFPSTDRWFFVIPAFIIGLLAGQLVGGRKDAKVRANNKIL